MYAKESSYRGTDLTVERAAELASGHSEVYLSLQHLSCEAARALKGFQGERLHIEGPLPAMDVCAAECLLVLGDTNKLSVDWMTALHHTKRLDNATILRLAQFANNVNLEGIHELGTQEAQILQPFQGTQLLLYPRTLSPEAGAVLSKAHPDLLSISVKEISEDAVRALAGTGAREEFQLCIEGKGLTPEMGSHLAKVDVERITLTGDTLSAESARRLADFSGTLRLQCPAITAEVALELAQSEGGLELFLDDIVLGQEIAEPFANGHNLFVHIYGIRSLEIGAAKSLESANKEVFIETGSGEVYDFTKQGR